VGRRGYGRRVATARVAGLLMVASAVVFAACGSGASPTPSAIVQPPSSALASTPASASSSASATGFPMPSGLTPAQREAVVTIPDPGDTSKPLAHLAAMRDLSPDELATALREDPSFAALENDALRRGFGKAVAAVDLAYDNGVTVTVAALGTGKDVFRFALRSSFPQPRYLLVEIDRGGKRITAYDVNGTVSLDLTTGKSTFDESPTAHHSCSFLHCFQTALWICMAIPVYGEVVGVTCEGCIELTGSGIGAALGAPVCLTCIATVVATLGASAWVCNDDPCGLCHSDSCGTAEPASEDHCTWWVGPPDPVTGNASWISRVNYGYACNGIETGPFGTGNSYEHTQCQQWSASGGLVTPCPFGCASPPPGDTSSRACMASPSVCDPSTCTGETPVGVQACSVRADDGASIVTRDYEVRGCTAAANGETCGTTTETRVLEECAGACAADGRSCEVAACDPATCNREENAGAQVCRAAHVTQPTRVYRCGPVSGTCESTVVDKPIQVCGAGCAADGQHCAGPGGGRTDTYAVTGGVWEAISPDAYDRCLTCTIRFSSEDGASFTAISGTDGGYSLSDVPSGTYRVERKCGGTWTAAHGPWDAALGYAAVTVPVTGNVDVLVPKCP
jgi:hypothetical protein